jgi:hypothetical protein
LKGPSGAAMAFLPQRQGNFSTREGLVPGPKACFVLGARVQGAGPGAGRLQLGAIQGQQAGDHLFTFPEGQAEVEIAEHQGADNIFYLHESCSHGPDFMAGAKSSVGFTSHPDPLASGREGKIKDKTLGKRYKNARFWPSTRGHRKWSLVANNFCRAVRLRKSGRRGKESFSNIEPARGERLKTRGQAIKISPFSGFGVIFQKEKIRGNLDDGSAILTYWGDRL